MRIPISLMLVSALALTGCATAPVPESTVDIPPQFSSAGSQPLPDIWWQHLEDPALDRLIQQALRQNFSLAATRARLAQARALTREARADRIPQVNGDVDASLADAWGDRQRRYGVGVAATYEVDLWGRIEAAGEAAALRAEATAADLETAAISLSAEVANLYYGLAWKAAEVELLESQWQTNSQITDLIALRNRLGQASVDELLRQRQLVEQSRTQLALAKADLRLLNNQLAVLLGQSATQSTELAAPALVELPPIPAAGVPAQWLQRRPDLRAAFYRLQAADQDVAQAVAQRYPRLNLSLAVESVADSPSRVFDDWLGSIAAGLTAPLIDGGKRRAAVTAAEAQRRALLADYRQTVLTAVREVEDALVIDQRDQAQLTSLNEQLQLAETALEQLRFRYRRGAVQYLDVLTALTSFQSLQRQVLSLRYQLLENRISLARTLAGGWKDTALGRLIDEVEPSLNQTADHAADE